MSAMKILEDKNYLESYSNELMKKEEYNINKKDILLLFLYIANHLTNKIITNNKITILHQLYEDQYIMSLQQMAPKLNVKTVQNIVYLIAKEIVDGNI